MFGWLGGLELLTLRNTCPEDYEGYDDPALDFLWLAANSSASATLE